MMQKRFGRSEFDSDFEPGDGGRDRELTLGPMSVAVLGLVLCAVCAGFFVWGYSVGHRNPDKPTALAAAATSAPSAAQIFSQSKPTASPANVPARSVTPDAADGSSADAASSAAAAVPATYPAETPKRGTEASPSVVQAALPTQGGAAQAAAVTGQVQPALGSATAWMVQIAAVSHQEDADVLTGALRKRGYVVTVRRDPVDSLMHVQVGPFATHSDALAMRQRLLNDGYNAIIEP